MDKNDLIIGDTLTTRNGNELTLGNIYGDLYNKFNKVERTLSSWTLDLKQCNGFTEDDIVKVERKNIIFQAD